MADGVVGTFAAALWRAARRRRTPVALCYHGVGPRPADGDPHGLMVDREAFAAQLDTLIGTGYRLVTAAELWAAVAADGPDAADGLAAITFDDGLDETLDTAAGMLAERGGRGTAFVPSDLLGSPHPDLPGHRIAGAAQLRELARAGMEIGSHSAGHHDLRLLAGDALERELADSRRGLEDVLGAPVAGIAYPYGGYTAATMAAARQAGYTYGCACSGPGPWRPFAVPREPVFPSTSTFRLRLKAAGLYGPVHAWRSR